MPDGPPQEALLRVGRMRELAVMSQEDSRKQPSCFIH
jgi:hypothetical protein